MGVASVPALAPRQVFINKINFWADEQGYKCCNVSRSYSGVKGINHKSKQLSTRLIRNIIQCFAAAWAANRPLHRKNTLSILRLMWLKRWHANAICGLGNGKGGRDNAIYYRRRCIPLFHFVVANRAGGKKFEATRDRCVRNAYGSHMCRARLRKKSKQKKKRETERPPRLNKLESSWR